MVKCNYCGDEIPKDRYVMDRYKLGIDRGYCSSGCKNRAGTLRMAVRNPKKYTPKTLDETDKKYMQDYVTELSLSPEEARGCN